MWYDYNPILSRNSMFNFIIGERGVGKTYGSKKFCINRFIKKGEQFIYVRRYKTELKESCGDTNKFFGAIAKEFPKHKLEVQGHTLKCDGQTMGYSIALSTSNILKSTSFEKVKYIIFDEFIIDKGCYHYLQNEVEQFLDLVETIARLRDIKVFFLGNAISITNPYFAYFKLTLPYNSDFKLFKDGLICVNYIKNELYRKKKHESNFGKLIDGTKYSEYAIDNQFLRDNKSFIRHKSSKARHYFNIIYNGKTYGVWKDWSDGMMYVSYDHDDYCQLNLVVNVKDHSENTLFLKNNSFMKNLIYHFRVSCLSFESQVLKSEIMELIESNLSY